MPIFVARLFNEFLKKKFPWCFQVKHENNRAVSNSCYPTAYRPNGYFIGVYDSKYSIAANGTALNPLTSIFGS